MSLTTALLKIEISPTENRSKKELTLEKEEQTLQGESSVTLRVT